MPVSLSIRARLIGAASLAALALVLVSLVGAASLAQTRHAFAAFAETEFSAQGRLVALRGHLGNVRRFEKDVLLNIDHLDKAKAYQARWREAVEGVRSAVAQAGPGGDAARMQRLQALLDDYERAAAQVLQKTINGQIVMGTEANELLEPAKRHLHAAEPLIEAVAAAIVEAGQARQREVAAAVESRLRLMGALAVLALAVLVPVMWLTVLSVTRPLRRAVRVAENVAAGDLATPVPVQGNDEIAQLMGALAAMQASLHAIVAQVRESTASIAGASSEIAAGNHDLSQRTEQTAAELQQTTAGVGRLADDMRRTEQAARSAVADADRATASAQQGGAVVLEVVSDMGHIAESSRRITSIVSVIDGIAFQTNLLALNAAVEAARAGPQGRGFAVVAGEVRVLAQRVAGAAREIKQLIDEAAAVVDAGAGRARDAGARMQEILQSVGAVCGAMAALSGHAASGSTQMQGIASAVDGLDAATQRNAALVEQSAAAAASLADQVQSLGALVGRFRLETAAA